MTLVYLSVCISAFCQIHAVFSGHGVLQNKRHAGGRVWGLGDHLRASSISHSASGSRVCSRLALVIWSFDLWGLLLWIIWEDSPGIKGRSGISCNPRCRAASLSSLEVPSSAGEWGASTLHISRAGVARKVQTLSRVVNPRGAHERHPTGGFSVLPTLPEDVRLCMGLKTDAAFPKRGMEGGQQQGCHLTNCEHRARHPMPPHRQGACSRCLSGGIVRQRFSFKAIEKKKPARFGPCGLK